MTWLPRTSFPLTLLVTLTLLPVLAARGQTTQHARRPLMVAYFPQWGVDSNPQYLVKDLSASGGAAHVDQVNYSQGSILDGRCSIADPDADLQYTFQASDSVNGVADSSTSNFRGNFHQLQELKRKFPQLKVLISLEGRADAFAKDAQPENRQAFVASCVDLFVRGRFADGIAEPGIFDGFDVDWEYPKQEDAANFLAVLRELRRQMDAVRPGLLLTVAVGSSPQMESGVDMNLLSDLVDEVGVMTYDYAGPWSSVTGFVAPLYVAQKYAHRQGSIDASVAEYRAAGVPAAKLLIGLPFYGYGWRQVGGVDHGLFQSGRAIHSDHPYWQIESLSHSSTVYRKRRSLSPWLYDGDAFYTYDDPASIRAKAIYARNHHLGGLMVWELSGDTRDAHLLKTADAYLKGRRRSAPGRALASRKPQAADHPSGD